MKCTNQIDSSIWFRNFRGEDTLMEQIWASSAYRLDGFKVMRLEMITKEMSRDIEKEDELCFGETFINT